MTPRRRMDFADWTAVWITVVLVLWLKFGPDAGFEDEFYDAGECAGPPGCR